MTRQEIIQDANQLTEGKAERRIDFERAYARRLQKFCQAKPFWWRKQTVSKDIPSGTREIDLHSDIRDFEAFKLVELWSAGSKVSRLDPCFDDERISEMEESVTSGLPDSYSVEIPLTLRFPCATDKDYKLKAAYWAIPNPNSDDPTDAVALVPEIYHHALVSGLKMDFSGFLYGVKSDMYLVAKAEYEEAITLALARPDFSNRKGTQWIDPDLCAVQSR